MGFFGEKYSKEKYEQAKKTEESELSTAMHREDDYDPDYSPEAMKRIMEELWGDYTKAHKRVERIYAAGQAEAIALNKEYDDLRAKAREAVEAVARFEQEKLGMGSENPVTPVENNTTK